MEDVPRGTLHSSANVACSLSKQQQARQLQRLPMSQRVGNGSVHSVAQRTVDAAMLMRARARAAARADGMRRMRGPSELDERLYRDDCDFDRFVSAELDDEEEEAFAAAQREADFARRDACDDDDEYGGAGVFDAEGDDMDAEAIYFYHCMQQGSAGAVASSSSSASFAMSHQQQPPHHNSNINHHRNDNLHNHKHNDNRHNND